VLVCILACGATQTIGDESADSLAETQQSKPFTLADTYHGKQSLRVMKKAAKLAKQGALKAAAEAKQKAKAARMLRNAVIVGSVGSQAADMLRDSQKKKEAQASSMLDKILSKADITVNSADTVARHLREKLKSPLHIAAVSGSSNVYSPYKPKSGSAGLRAMDTHRNHAGVMSRLIIHKGDTEGTGSKEGTGEQVGEAVAESILHKGQEEGAIKVLQAQAKAVWKADHPGQRPPRRVRAKPERPPAKASPTSPASPVLDAVVPEADSAELSAMKKQLAWEQERSS